MSCIFSASVTTLRPYETCLDTIVHFWKDLSSGLTGVGKMLELSSPGWALPIPPGFPASARTKP